MCQTCQIDRQHGRCQIDRQHGRCQIDLGAKFWSVTNQRTNKAILGVGWCGLLRRSMVWRVVWEHSGTSGLRHSSIHTCWRSCYWSSSWCWWSFPGERFLFFYFEFGRKSFRPSTTQIRSTLKLLLQRQFDSPFDWYVFDKYNKTKCFKHPTYVGNIC